MKTIKTVLLVLTITAGLIMQSCSSDDNSSIETNCSNITDQPVQGNFMGTDFISPQGYYQRGGFENDEILYYCEIYVREPIGGDCLFAVFDGPKDDIRFLLPSLEPQIVDLSSSIDNQVLAFNRIVNGTTEIEFANCATVEITNYDSEAGELQGKIYAEGEEGSIVDGNFTLDFCGID
ncbi:hypothetical protein [Winogradskyella sp.]|uniref:hypothetical protein n=1 Tax=Winogradskyella sp. TaxID=1883156 RepID=UPI0026390F83|nr:hypothetical protein [Winogradskyella sp.]